MRWCVECGGSDCGGGGGGGGDGGGGEGDAAVHATHFFWWGAGGCHGPAVPKNALNPLMAI